MVLNKFNTFGFYKRYIEDLIESRKCCADRSIGIIGPGIHSYILIKIIRSIPMLQNCKIVYLTTDLYDPISLSFYVTKKVDLPDPASALNLYQETIDNQELSLVLGVSDSNFYLKRPSRYSKSGILTPVFGPSFDLYEKMLNRAYFTNVLDDVKIKHLKTIIVSDPDELASYKKHRFNIIKNQPYENSWIVQDKIDGDEYGSVSLCIDSKLFGTILFRTHQHISIDTGNNGMNMCTCASEISTPCVLTYVDSMIHEDIEDDRNSHTKRSSMINFVHDVALKIAGETGYVGILCIDYVRDRETGKLIPIRMNPNNAVGLEFFKHHFFTEHFSEHTKNKICIVNDMNSYFHKKIILSVPVFMNCVSRFNIFGLFNLMNRDPLIKVWDPLPIIFVMIRTIVKLITGLVMYGLKFLSQTHRFFPTIDSIVRFCMKDYISPSCVRISDYYVNDTAKCSTKKRQKCSEQCSDNCSDHHINKTSDCSEHSSNDSKDTISECSSDTDEHCNDCITTMCPTTRCTNTTKNITTRCTSTSTTLPVTTIKCTTKPPPTTQCVPNCTTRAQCPPEHSPDDSECDNNKSDSDDSDQDDQCIDYLSVEHYTHEHDEMLSNPKHRKRVDLDQIDDEMNSVFMYDASKSNHKYSHRNEKHSVHDADFNLYNLLCMINPINITLKIYRAYLYLLRKVFKSINPLNIFNVILGSAYFNKKIPNKKTYRNNKNYTDHQSDKFSVASSTYSTHKHHKHNRHNNHLTDEDDVSSLIKS